MLVDTLCKKKKWKQEGENEKGLERAVIGGRM